MSNLNLSHQLRKSADESNNNWFDSKAKSVIEKLTLKAKQGKYSYFWRGYLETEICAYLEKEGFTVINYIEENPKETGVLIKWG